MGGRRFELLENAAEMRTEQIRVLHGNAKPNQVCGGTLSNVANRSTPRIGPLFATNGHGGSASTEHCFGNKFVIDDRKQTSEAELANNGEGKENEAGGRMLGVRHVCTQITTAVDNRSGITGKDADAGGIVNDACVGNGRPTVGADASIDKEDASVEVQRPNVSTEIREGGDVRDVCKPLTIFGNGYRKEIRSLWRKT